MNFEKYFKTLVQIVPLVTAIFILFSAISYISFYSMFNINIVEYVSISEYIPLFLTDIVILILSIPVLIAPLFWIEKDFELQLKKNKPTVQSKKARIIYRTLFFLFFFTFFLFVSEIFFSRFRYDFLLDFIESNLKSWEIGIIFWTGSLSLFFYWGSFDFYKFTKEELKENEEQFLTSNESRIRKKQQCSYLGYSFLTFFVFCILNATFNLKVIIDNKNRVEYTLITKDSNTIQTDNNIKYLGKTQDYTFLFYKNEKLTKVLKNDNIEERIVVQKE